MILYNEIKKQLPPEFPGNLKEINRKEFLERNFSIIVLDDDPTGTQTIFDVPVLTSWNEPEILDELQNATPLFFILTNSRSLISAEADKLAFEIGQNIQAASQKTGRKTIVISRGDSTLRGHYPNEVDALGVGLGVPNASHILIPAFFEGGRHTVNDIHYVREGDELIPAGETPFAQDSTFGYRSSDLKNYVEEKTKGRLQSDEVISVSLDDIRKGGPEKIAEILNALRENQVCIVNAFSQSDLDVFTAGFYQSDKITEPVLFRSAASIIPGLAGLPVKPPLQKNDFDLSGKGGIVAVGSYVPKTTKQLEYLQKNFQVEYIEIQAKKLLHKNGFHQEIKRVAEKINANLEKDQVVVVYTSRKLIKGKDADESLQIVNKISAGMVEVMRGIKIRPKFFIAKGGITSSDIVTKSFGVKKAKVLGQVIPGVPAWQLNDCKQFPGLVYMPFPGNLGGDD
ncbi:MAG: four-carbon acid sugar kinase family protein, partial [Bacteroidota bacterium]